MHYIIARIYRQGFSEGGMFSRNNIYNDVVGMHDTPYCATRTGSVKY